MASFDHIEKIDGVDIPFKIFIERRKSVRVSFGRSCINLRMPSALSSSERKVHFERSINWVKKHISNDPDSIRAYIGKNYDEIQAVEIFGKTLGLNIAYSGRKTGRGDFSEKNQAINLQLPDNLLVRDKKKMIQSLLSRICGQLFLPEITKRVHEINDKCFHKEIKSVNLKYNKSNWGSCSTANNINLSTRLLFAPMEVIDYVIVHELAHLYEMNHSAKFWNIVSQVMPDYKEKEAWLKKHGSTCDF